MAVGDAAGAKGLATYTDSLLVKDVDNALNQRGDDTAATMTRLDTVEAAALGKPMFSVQRGTFDQNIVHNNWYQVVGNVFASPVINTGFTSWTTGALTIKRSGVYTVGAHVQYYGQGFTTVGVQLTKNGNGVDTTDMLCKDEWGGGGSAVPAATATAYNVVRLVAGDVIRMWTLQRNANGSTVPVGKVAGDVTMSLMWENN
ncbi:hypothetical protein [Frigoribacterium sp. VKM Ac-2836]|uniref:hypothetical protein n=1 Tax=Frigoribacterium sp. VKM Ac-2836 TaxID=2739014 RepID=UPI001565C15E|nr:hypothetical protein [Frigoribacterium sp. VKM Ac-2836]NRD25849.1 hypothetical protein [Frigoribacterium sp. VKM Ac-2836]